MLTGTVLVLIRGSSAQCNENATCPDPELIMSLHNRPLIKYDEYQSWQAAASICETSVSCQSNALIAAPHRVREPRVQIVPFPRVSEN